MRTERTEQDALLTPRQAAGLLAVAPRSLESWRHRGQGPAFVRIGRLVRYRASDLERWIGERTVGAAGPAAASPSISLAFASSARRTGSRSMRA